MRDGAGSAFWSLVKRESRAVAVSRAVVVDGGLSPPPSKIYPGTKCYMVTVRVDGEEHLGFGPSPSIAQRAAILEAYKCLHSCKNGEVVKLSEAFAGDVSGSEEGGEVMSEAVSPESMPPSQTAAHLASSHYEDADSTSSLHVHHSKDDTDLSKAADRVLNELLEVSQRKAVDIQFEFMFMTTEVVAVVLGGGLSFVGKHKEKLLAGKEAASKMIAALMEWPNALPCHPGESNVQLLGPPALPLVPSLLPWSPYPSHPPQHPFLFRNRPPPLPPPLNFHNGSTSPRLPFPPPHSIPPHPGQNFAPLPPPPHHGQNFAPLPPPHHGQNFAPLRPPPPHWQNFAPLQPPLQRPGTQMFPPFPPPPPCDEQKFASFQGFAPFPHKVFALCPLPQNVTPHPHHGNSSSGEEDSPPLSHGLREVVPRQCCKETNATCKVSKPKEKFPLNDISPFESQSQYPDPFQFTVRVPQTEKKASLLGEPPWRCQRKHQSPKDKTSFLGKLSWNSPSPQRPRAGKQRKKRKARSQTKTSPKTLPVHPVLTDNDDSHVMVNKKESQSVVAGEKGFPLHPILTGSESTPLAECSPDQSLPAHWLLGSGDVEAELSFHSFQITPVTSQDPEAEWPHPALVTSQDPEATPVTSQDPEAEWPQPAPVTSQDPEAKWPHPALVTSQDPEAAPVTSQDQWPHPAALRKEPVPLDVEAGLPLSVQAPLAPSHEAVDVEALPAHFLLQEENLPSPSESPFSPGPSPPGETPLSSGPSPPGETPGPSPPGETPGPSPPGETPLSPGPVPSGRGRGSPGWNRSRDRAPSQTTQNLPVWNAVQGRGSSRCPKPRWYRYEPPAGQIQNTGKFSFACAQERVRKMLRDSDVCVGLPTEGGP